VGGIRCTVLQPVATSRTQINAMQSMYFMRCRCGRLYLNRFITANGVVVNLSKIVYRHVFVRKYLNNMLVYQGMKLKNKIILITGASDGIGKQIALRLAKEGTQLALIARDEARLNEVVAKCKEIGATNARAYLCDIRQTAKLASVIKKIISDFGHVNVLINNAGVWQKLKSVDELDAESIDEVIETNLSAVIHTTNLLLPILRQQKEAAIINICSKSGVVAQEKQSVYTASKYGVRGFTEVLKADLKGSSVRVAGVYQSGTNTQLFAKVGDKPPIEKFTNPADLADVIAYMLSLPEKIWLHDVRVEY